MATNSFSEMLSRAPVDAPQEDRLLICKHGEESGKLYSVLVNSLNHSGETTKIVVATNVENQIYSGESPLLCMPVTSCHSLILLVNEEIDRIWTVWNPFTTESIELPQFDHLTRGTNSSGGIGYDAVSGDYKVVRITALSDGSLETLIYSVKANCWSRIDDCTDFFCWCFGDENGVFLNGVLHWFTLVRHQGFKIIAFDLGIETYCLIPLPGTDVEPMDKYLDASGGCLFVSYSYEDSFDVWMLNDQGGGENIWSKFVLLDRIRLNSVGIYVVDPRLIYYSRSKHQVLIQNDDHLLWFDVENKCGTKVSIRGINGSFSCQAFPTSWLDGNRETTASNGSLKRKRLSPGDSLSLKLKAENFGFLSHAGC